MRFASGFFAAATSSIVEQQLRQRLGVGRL